MFIAQTLLTQGLPDKLVLIGTNRNLLRGEMFDLQHASTFLPRTKLIVLVDYTASIGSDLCIVTAGARQRHGESEAQQLQKNVAHFKKVIP